LLELGGNALSEWTNRPVEVANLLNPAFCSVIIFETAKAYQKEVESSLPYSLSFLILPIVLHEGTRDRLPRATSTKMHSWVRGNSDLRIGFAERTRHMLPYTKEGLLFGMTMSILGIDGRLGTVDVYQKHLQRPKWQRGTEADICTKKAALLGKWFALSGDSTTIFSMWGIRP